MVTGVVPHVTIGLLEVVRPGNAAMLVRADMYDKEQIDKAAKIVGMKQAEFTRTVLTLAANAIIEITEKPSDEPKS